MKLSEYIDQRLNEGEREATIQGLRNDVLCSLGDAALQIPADDWNAGIRQRQKETSGETMIWLEGSSEPDYVIQQ